ncbi:MAG: hypothetical protein HeimAB125_23150 [Candidatus Heimdallarchaeota archaeon AB_125]|nr:MAG: hypothetical protein HeimAB125_23150 [Candidatus Heimdallarchaeota archaeon AB_125]
MSESNVQYFKLLAKKYDIEEDIYKKLGNLQDLKKKIAHENKKRANDNKDREEHLIKKAEFENQGVPDKALKSEVSAKKKEAAIAEKDYKISELERKIQKVEEELEKLEFELKEAEADISAHEGGEPAPVEESVYEPDPEPVSAYVPLEPTVLDDKDDSEEDTDDEPLTTTYDDY